MRSFVVQGWGFLLAGLAILTLVAVACGNSAQRESSPEGPTTFGGDDSGAADPTTCEGAASLRSHSGCDFYPVVTVNLAGEPGSPSLTSMHFAVVLANGQQRDAAVTIDTPAGFSKSITLAANSTQKIELPWHSALASTRNASVLAKGAGYHIRSAVPIVAYQFNPYEATGTNDASTLLPVASWGSTYRVTGVARPRKKLIDVEWQVPFVSITAAEDDTHVTVELGPAATTMAGVGLEAGSPGKVLTLQLNRGDVAQILAAVATDTSEPDASGSLVKASKPVQVLTGSACSNVPATYFGCDHLEEVVLPAEALGKKYLLARPLGPTTLWGLSGGDAGTDGAPNSNVQPRTQFVRFYGNRDGTLLTYSPNTPPDCPDRLNAGEVRECLVTSDFVVTGNQEFAVNTFLTGNPDLGANSDLSPSQNLAIPIEQYSSDYLFATPAGWYNTVTVLAEAATSLELDGIAANVVWDNVGAGLAVARILLEEGAGRESHRLRAPLPFGIQVAGYLPATSYAYPGGMSARKVSSAPIR